jgi:hypothetical protein
MQNQKNTNITVEWVVGQLETDGNFSLNIDRSNGNLKPIIKLASTSNTNTLDLFADWVCSIGINPKFESGKQVRACSVKVEGKNQVLRLLKVLRQSSISFTGGKFRDALLVEIALKKTLTPAQKIGLKKSLHKANRHEVDLKTSTQTVSRQEYERRMGIQIGSSVTESEAILRCIDILSRIHSKCLLDQCAANTLSVPPDYIKGVVDGDGSISVITQVRDERIHWGLNFSVALDANSAVTAEILKYCFKSNVTITQVESRKNPGQITSLNLAFRNEKDIDSVLNYFNVHGRPLGDLRNKEFDLAYEYQLLKQNNGLRDYTIALAFLNKIYRLSELIQKGAKRTPFQETSQALEKMCGLN